MPRATCSTSCCPTPSSWSGRERIAGVWRGICGGGTVLALLASAGCGSDSLPDGAAVYAARCGYCHDVDGSIGTRLTDAVLARYKSVGTLRAYLPLAMPYEAPGSLTGPEYEAVLRHLLVGRGLIPGRYRDERPPDSVTITRAEG